MIVLGANSDVAKAFVEKILKEQHLKRVYLCSSNPKELAPFKAHLEVKYSVDIEVIEFNLLANTVNIDYSALDYKLVFCASGYLGKPAEKGILDEHDSLKIVTINYAKLVVELNKIATDLVSKGSGTIIGLSSVAGERGRQSNFLYGSAKAGFTAYLSGLRNYLVSKNCHVLTVKPGFMDTKMIEDIDTPKPLTITAEKAAHLIYKGYKSKKNTIYIAGIWRYIMAIIKMIPEFIFKKLSL
jgi:short-subunit dehydrogenase